MSKPPLAQELSGNLRPKPKRQETHTGYLTTGDDYPGLRVECSIPTVPNGGVVRGEWLPEALTEEVCAASRSRGQGSPGTAQAGRESRGLAHLGGLAHGDVALGQGALGEGLGRHIWLAWLLGRFV